MRNRSRWTMWIAMTMVFLGATQPSAAKAQGQDFLDWLLKETLNQPRSRISSPSANSTPSRAVDNPQFRGPIAPEDTEPYAFSTADGWTLVIHRYTRPGGPRSELPPVILCHGLGYNALFWDLEPSVSLPRYLCQRGYDVWSLSLRGAGLSRKWVSRIDQAPEVLLGTAIRKLTKGKLAPTGYASLDPKYADWSLEDHIKYDVAAAVGFVRKKTSAAEVIWIGHSMGGIAALGHLSRNRNPGIGKLIVISSQVTMSNGQIFLQYLSESLKSRELLMGGRLGPDDAIKRVTTTVENLFFNQRNVSPSVYQALTTWAKDYPSIGVLKQYLRLANKGTLTDGSGRFNYAQAISQVQVPILIMGGVADQLAPPKTQIDLGDRVGSTDKTLILLGKQYGLSTDYGHNDAIVGLKSRAEVYPLFHRWLNGDRF